MTLLGAHRIPYISRIKVKNVWNYTSTPLIGLYSVDRGNLVQITDKLTFLAYEAPCPETFWTNPPTTLEATCRRDVPLEGVVT